MARRARKSDCPIHFALRVFGDAWTLLILRDFMFEGKSSYTEFLKSEERIATNILADRLARLEEDGIIKKEKTAQGREGRHYRLTAKGVDLVPTIVEIIAWSIDHGENVAVQPEFLRRLQTNKNRLIRDVRARLSREGRSADPRLKPDRAKRRVKKQPARAANER